MQSLHVSAVYYSVLRTHGSSAANTFPVIETLNSLEEGLGGMWTSGTILQTRTFEPTLWRTIPLSSPTYQSYKVRCPMNGKSGERATIILISNGSLHPPHPNSSLSITVSDLTVLSVFIETCTDLRSTQSMTSDIRLWLGSSATGAIKTRKNSEQLTPWGGVLRRFHRTRRFTTVFTRTCRWKLFWARWIQSTSSHPNSLRYIPIFLLATASRPALWSTQPTILLGIGCPFLGVKAAGAWI
jgi:hypothetical protein